MTGKGQHIVFGLVGLMIGLIVGFFGANALNRGTDSPIVNGGAPPTPNQSSNSQVLPDVADMLGRAEAEPQNFAIQMRTGDMYAGIGKFDKAIEFYTKGISLKPDDFNAHVVIANAYFDSRQFVRAGEHYSKAIEIDPKNPDARADLGATFAERENADLERAVREFNTALEIEPGHAPSLYYLGTIHARRGDTDEAQKMLSKLENTSPNSDLIQRLRQRLQEPTAPVITQ